MPTDNNGVTITRAQLRMERVIAHRPDPLTGLRRRDMAGNKLVDVVSRETGFVTGVRSALESPANNTPDNPRSGISVSQADIDALPTCDPNTGLWWVGKDRLVQRTIDTPEGPLTVARVVKPSVAEKLDRRAEAASKVKRAPKSVSTEKQGRKPETRAQRTGVSESTITAKEIRDYIARKYNFTGKITPEIRRAAMVAIEHERQVRDYTRDSKTNRNNGNNSATGKSRRSR